MLGDLILPFRDHSSSKSSLRPHCSLRLPHSQLVTTTHHSTLAPQPQPRSIWSSNCSLQHSLQSAAHLNGSTLWPSSTRSLHRRQPSQPTVIPRRPNKKKKNDKRLFRCHC
ncbi:uncharacterized protein LOC125471583 [Pyrus x bretschneideri]|uniref:uncharacterized protein LOC125471583 n=1 Tax=Pyrus x bretschneideri TaxID=225117 RepID=UPI0020304482|nr:uncharacterized protein LOC125471583 [Pyrus x bretschneideri]